MDVEQIIEQIRAQDKWIDIKVINNLTEDDLYFLIVEVGEIIVFKETDGTLLSMERYLKKYRPDFLEKYRLVFGFSKGEKK